LPFSFKDTELALERMVEFPLFFFCFTEDFFAMIASILAYLGRRLRRDSSAPALTLNGPLKELFENCGATWAHL
jgi:hypothetical protein